MLVLFTFCDIPWWLTWLLPFLLGLALGWLLWSRYRALFDQSQSDLTLSQKNYAELLSEVEIHKKQISNLQGELALCRGRMREMESAGDKSSVGATKLAAANISGSSGEGASARWAAAVGDDQLQIIEGIGPKMEAILKENGMLNFSIIASSSAEKLRDILNKYGDKYRIIDPNSWPQQAQLAHDRKYQDLIDFQKSLDGGRTDTANDSLTDSKLEKFLIKAGALKRWKQDDLKAVEGIGPKIETLLLEQNITTWEQLSHTEVDVLHSILEKAGPRFQLADPSTWPRQARLAAESRWDELQAYQDALNGGREK